MNKKTTQQRVVLIDDDFAIRQTIKSFLSKIFPQADIYTSANGVEGLGLVISTNPQVVILDLTLPKYSGRELIEFLSTNEGYNSKDKTTIVVLNDDKKRNINLPEGYIKLDKRDPYFLHKLTRTIGERRKWETNNGKDFRYLLCEKTINWANRGDLLVQKLHKATFPRDLYIGIKWLLYQLAISIYLTGVRIFLGKGKESYIEQKKMDVSSFRVRYYPTLTTIFGSAGMIILQLFLFVVGGMTIFNVRLESILATGSGGVEINLVDSEYNTEEIEFAYGEVRLKEREMMEEEKIEEPIEDDQVDPSIDSEPDENDLDNQTDQVNLNEEEVLGVEDLAEEAVVQPVTTYSTEKPAITFNQKVQYSRLVRIEETSSLNTAETSVLTGEMEEVLPQNAITYQLSPDNINWYYYPSADSTDSSYGSSGQVGWEKTTAGWISSNTVQEVNKYIGTFGESTVESKDLYIRAYLHSDGETLVSLGGLSVVRELDVVTRVEEERKPTGEMEILKVDEPESLFFLEPVVLNAAYANGNKVIAGRVDLLEGMSIEDSDLGNYKVNIYYTDSRDIKTAAKDKEDLIGEAELQKIEVYGNVQYVFELRTSSDPGGYITVEVIYNPVGVANLQPSVSDLSKPVENATLTVNEGGDQGDASAGDGSCDHDTGTPGSQCTLRAAIQEANSLAGADNIYFNILNTDPSYRDYDDPDTPGSGDGIGGDDYFSIRPASSYPSISDQTNFDGSTQPGSSCNSLDLLIEITGMGTIYNGIGLYSSNSSFRGFIVNNFTNMPLWVDGASNVSLTCNIIGLDASGINSPGGNAAGLYVQGSLSDLSIGGPNIGDGNVFSGNDLYGIFLYTGSGEVIEDVNIQNNFVGTDVSGNLDLGNDSHGIYLYAINPDGIKNVEIQSNLISGNGGNGLFLRRYNSNVEIENNIVGLNASESISIGNDNHGVYVIDSSNISIGGLDANDSNNISHNQYRNISIQNVSSNIEVIGNNISDAEIGVSIDTSSDVEVKSNEIYENDYYGVWIANSSSNNLIQSNEIYNNGQNSTHSGILVLDGVGNAILSNDIYNNAGLGIDLGNDGVTANDSGDTDTGPNNLQNYPQVVFLSEGEDYIEPGFMLDTQAGYYRVELFYSLVADPTGYGEGENFLCYFNVNHAGGLDFHEEECLQSSFPDVPPEGGNYLTLTVTRCTDATCTDFTDTSEFSNTTITGGIPVVNSTGDGADLDEYDGACYTGSTNSEGRAECTLRAAIEEITLGYGNLTGYDIYFDIPESDIGCLSFEDNDGAGYDPDATEVSCLAANADPDIKWWRGEPATSLPVIDRDLHIYANTQPEYVPNTNEHPEFLNGQPVIELSCEGESNCVSIEGSSSDVLIAGLVINSATDANIYTNGATAGGPYLQSSYIGTDISGTKLKGSTPYGIEAVNSEVHATANAAESRNIVVGNVASIYAFGDDSYGSEVVLSRSILGLLNDASVVSSDAVIILDGISEISAALYCHIAGGVTYGGIYIKDTVDVDYSGVEISNNLIYSNQNGIYFERTPGPPWGLDSSSIVNNEIYNNTNAGINMLLGDDPVMFSQNSIHDNGGLGIDLEDDGVTANDAGDGDTGVNGLQNFPVITSTVSDEDSTDIEFSLDAEAGYYRVEFFNNTSTDTSGYGEGETYLCYTDITHTGSGSESFSASCDSVTFENAPASVNSFVSAITLKCTDASCSSLTDTSEFSANEIVGGSVVVNSTGNSADNNVGDGLCSTGGVNSEGLNECTLRAAIEETNASAGAETILFDIPDSDPNHMCYENDGVADQITAGNATATSIQDDPSCGGTSIDPDHPYSWFDLQSTGTYTLTDEVMIDGYTQDGASKNTSEMGETLNNVIKIDTSDATFTFNGGNSEITGIAMTSGTAGINFNSAENRIYGIFFGVDVSGRNSTGSGHRINVNGSDNIIGSDLNGVVDNSEINILNADANARLLEFTSENGDRTWIKYNYMNTGITGTETGGDFKTNEAIGFSGTCAACVLDGIEIEYNTIANNRRGFTHRSYQNYTITNIKINNNKFNTDWAEQLVLNNYVTDSYTGFDAIFVNYSYGGPPWGGIGGEVKNNIIRNYYQIYSSGGNGGVIIFNVKDGTTFENNKIYGATFVNIRGNIKDMSKAENLIIRNNYLEVLDPGSYDYMTAPCINIYLISNSIIEGNIFTNACLGTAYNYLGETFGEPYYSSIIISYSNDNLVRKNLIGTADGHSLNNNYCYSGIALTGSPSISSGGNIIGGADLEEANIIVGLSEFEHEGTTYYPYAVRDYTTGGEANTISHNLIGVDSTGQNALGITGGIYSKNKINVIGNVMAGLDQQAVLIEGTDAITSEQTEITGNCIGTASDCTTPLDTPGGGIFINRDISDVDISDNIIANLQSSTYGGITLGNHSISGISMSGNKIYNTEALPINIQAGTEDSYGVTENDSGDTDTGPNELMNYPEITKVEYLGAGYYRIYGDIDDNSSEEPIYIEVCESSDHESGHGGCIQSLGTTMALSPWVTNVLIEDSDGLDGRTFSVLATNNLGSTSEFGTYAEEYEDIEIIEYPIELIYPIGGEEIDDTTPQLDWNTDNPEIDYYEIYLDGELYEVQLSSQTAHQITESLSYDTHTWQVIAYRGDPEGSNYETGRSIVETFTVVPPTYTFELVYPVNVVIDDTTPLFDWTDVPEDSEATYYEVYLDGEFLMGEIPVGTSEYQLLDEVALEEGMHRWQVVAYYLDVDGDLVEVGRTSQEEFEVRLPEMPDTGDDIVEPVIQDEPEVEEESSTVKVVKSMGKILIEMTRIIVAPLALILAFPGWLKRREKNPWGVVYDKSTKKPISYAAVRLYKGVKLIEQKYTDSEGRYGFKIANSKEILRVEVVHKNYETVVVGVKSDKGGVVTQDIGLMTRKENKRSVEMILRQVMVNSRETFPIIAKVIYIWGAAFSIIATILSPITWNGIILIFYGVIGVAYYVLYIRINRGRVYDTKSGKGISRAFIKIYRQKVNELVDVRITDEKGRFMVVLKPGKYNLLASKKGYSFPQKQEKKEIKKSFYGSMIEIEVVKKQILRIDVGMDPSLSS